MKTGLLQKYEAGFFLILMIVVMLANASIVKSAPPEIPSAVDDIIISNEYPLNNTLATYNPRLSVNISDPQERNLTVRFETYNEKEKQWLEIGTKVGNNGVYTMNTLGSGMDDYNRTFLWRVIVSDNTSSIQRDFSFLTMPFVFKWSYNTSTNVTLGPLAVDVNGDGIYEVFFTGEGKISCVNGATGDSIWNFTDPHIMSHSPFEIHDLNNDGIPEMVISAGEWTFALHANDGSLYWPKIRIRSEDKHLVIADIEGDGYPYVYIVSEDVTNGSNGIGRLRKLNGTNGKVLKEVFTWRPCWGGLSIADANNDGKFEIYMGDRSAYYHPPSLGKGIQAYDAETLDLLWYYDEITCSSHIPAIIDVNGDGVLDAVALDQSGNGTFVVDGKKSLDKAMSAGHNVTADLMTGKYGGASSAIGTAHSQFSIGDVDGDGHLELINSRSVFDNDTGIFLPTKNDSEPKIWDLSTWTLKGTLNGTFDEPPKMADVIGDSQLEIIGADNSVKIYNGSAPFQNIATIDTRAIASTLVQDIDNDGQNELILIDYNGFAQVYDTGAYAPPYYGKPMVRTNALYYSERRLGAGVYIPLPGAPWPIITNINIVNGSTNVPFNPILSAHIVDFQNAKMNIKISTRNKASGSWKTIFSQNDVGNGWYTNTTTDMDQPNTTYYWRVSAIDPNIDNNLPDQIFSFTTSACNTSEEFLTYFEDNDSDGFGNSTNMQQSCQLIGNGPPAGFVFNNTDCNDSNANVNPGAAEICDGIDNNCNGQIDELDLGNGTFGNVCDCGNEAIDLGEQCDGSDFQGKTCASYGYNSGSLTCTSTCTIDSGSCSNAPTHHNGGGGGGGGGSGGSTTTSKDWICGNWSECIDGKQKQSCTSITGSIMKTNTQNCTSPVIEPAQPAVTTATPTNDATSDASTQPAAENITTEGTTPAESANADENINNLSSAADANGITGAVTGKTSRTTRSWLIAGILIIVITAGLAAIIYARSNKMKKKPVPIIDFTEHSNNFTKRDKE